MAAAALVGSAVGGAMSAYQTYRAGQITKSVNDQQANLEEQDADRTIAAANEDARVIRYQGKQLAGTQIEGYSSSGVTLEGSPLAVLQESRTNNELDAMKTEYGGQLQALHMRQDAAQRRYSGDVAYQSGIMGGATTLLTSGLNVAGTAYQGAQQQKLYQTQMDYYSRR